MSALARALLLGQKVDIRTAPQVSLTKKKAPSKKKTPAGKRGKPVGSPSLRAETLGSKIAALGPDKVLNVSDYVFFAKKPDGKPWLDDEGRPTSGRGKGARAQKKPDNPRALASAVSYPKMVANVKKEAGYDQALTQLVDEGNITEGEAQGLFDEWAAHANQLTSPKAAPVAVARRVSLTRTPSQSSVLSGTRSPRSASGILPISARPTTPRSRSVSPTARVGSLSPGRRVASPVRRVASPVGRVGSLSPGRRASPTRVGSDTTLVAPLPAVEGSRRRPMRGR